MSTPAGARAEPAEVHEGTLCLHRGRYAYVGQAANRPHPPPAPPPPPHDEKGIRPTREFRRIRSQRRGDYAATAIFSPTTTSTHLLHAAEKSGRPTIGIGRTELILPAEAKGAPQMVTVFRPPTFRLPHSEKGTPPARAAKRSEPLKKRKNNCAPWTATSASTTTPPPLAEK